MTINNFARQVCKGEGGKVNLPIAQVMEVLKVANKLLGGALYALIKGTK